MFLVDTDICICLIKQKSLSVVAKIKAYEPYQIKISAVTVAELEYGAAKSRRIEQNRMVILKFLSSFEIIPFDDHYAGYFGKIRAFLEKAGNIIGPYDMQIAAQALCRDLILVTNNVKEFESVPELAVENRVL